MSVKKYNLTAMYKTITNKSKLKATIPYIVGYTFSLIFLFENTVSTSCSVISSIMENFVIIHSQKLREKTPLEVEIDKAIEGGNIVCVLGNSGVGKSYACNRILKEYSFVDFENNLLKSKLDTREMLDKLKGSATVLYFDDLNPDLPGFSIVREFILDVKHAHGPVLINSRSDLRLRCIFQDHDVVFFEINGPNKRNDIIRTYCKDKFNLEVSEQDAEYSTKDNVYDLLCKGGKGYQRVMDVRMEEHGHTADIIFTNYRTDTIEESAIVADAFSRADTLDTLIYKGMWDAIPYFTIESCVYPSIYTKNKLEYSNLTPGAVWTKYCNQSLREKQFRNMRTRHPSMVHDTDFVSYFMAMAQHKNVNDIIAICESYNLESPDIDFMNHLVHTKLKGKALSLVKKHLKKHGNLQRRQQAIRQVRD